MTVAQALERLQQLVDDDSGGDSEAEEEIIDKEVVIGDQAEKNSDIDEENDSSEEEADNENTTSSARQALLPGKDGTEWSQISFPQPQERRRVRRNVLRSSPGPTHHAKDRLNSFFSAFKIILDQALVEMIVRYMEMEAERRGYHDFTTSTGELYCFIGILLARGVAAKGVPLKDLWHQTWGVAFFAKSMSRDRFLLL